MSDRSPFPKYPEHWLNESGQIRLPHEVFAAASGDTGPLEERLKSESILEPCEREALCMLIKGELKPPPPEQKRLAHLHAASPEGVSLQKIWDAVAMVKFIMHAIREKEGTAKGQLNNAIAAARECYGLTDDEERKVIAAHHDSKKLPRRPKAQDVPLILKMYHGWLQVNGKLHEPLPQALSHEDYWTSRTAKASLPPKNQDGET